jgi:nitronate monooxygenase
MLQHGALTPLADRITQLEQAQASPFGVNFLLPFLDRDHPDDVELAASRAQLVEFFYDTPDPDLIGLVHTGGALAGWQVGSAQEARQAVDGGCDLVIAQGIEAGGHVRGSLGLVPLLAEVLEVVQVPVLAAGGITTGRAMATVPGAGAAGPAHSWRRAVAGSRAAAWLAGPSPATIPTRAEIARATAAAG